MAQKILSITLGTTSAKIAEIVKTGKKIQVYSAYDIPISEGLCDDGYILDVDSLASELSGNFQKYKIRTKKLAFSIASKRIASKEVIIPFVKEKQIKGLIEMNAQDYFPVGNIEDYLLSYSIIETVKNAENTQYRLNVVAAPTDLLEGYTNLAKALKCTAEIVDYAGNAILQVLKTQAHTGEINAILQLGHENTVINIMNGNVQIMQRSIANGLNALVTSVSESVGLDEEDSVAFLEDNDIGRICAAYPDVKYICDSLVSSIGRIFEYYNSRSSEHPITGVMYIGDATCVNGIGELLSEGLGVEATEIHRLNCVQSKSKNLTDEAATNFLSNIGAVINPMNLKYDKKDEEEKVKEEGKLPWGLVVISFVAAVALIAASFTMYYLAKQERNKLSSQLNALSNVQQVEVQLSEAQTKLSAIEEFYNSTKGPNDSLLRLIKDLEKVMPKGMSIENFALSDDGTVTITGGGAGKESVAKFIQQMRDLKYVKDVKVDLINESIDVGGMYDTFTMSFTLLDVNAIEEEEAKNFDVIEIEEPTEVTPEAETEEPTEVTPENEEGGNE